MAKKKRAPAYPDHKMEYKEYMNKLTPEQQQYVKRFYDDLYAGGVFKEGSLLKSEDAKQEAIKNHNSLTRDAMDVGQRRGKLSGLDENTVQFMEDASDDWEWQDEYATHGFKAAAKMIYDQAENDLQNKNLSVKITLTRFFEKISGLKRLNWRDRKHKRKAKK